METQNSVVTMERRGASRAKLLTAARALFVERGYHDTRPQDIAKAAGVGHGTFYLHFSDKRECFLSFVESAANEFAEMIKPVMDSNAKLDEIIRLVMEAVYKYAQDHPGVLEAAMTDPGLIDKDADNHPVLLIDRWAISWSETIKRLQAAGQLRADADPLLTGYAIIGVLNRASAGAFKNKIDTNSFLQFAVSFIMEGLKPS